MMTSTDGCVSMSYHRRVVKRRPASLTVEEWLEVVERGKLPRPGLPGIPGQAYPPPDVRDLVDQEILRRLLWRVEEIKCQMLRPTTSTSASGSSGSAVSRCELLTPFSELWEFLTKASYSDGTPRATGQISLKLASGGIQVTLTDPTSATYCCQTASSLQDAFLALEIGLKDGSLGWRPSGYARETKRKN